MEKCSVLLSKYYPLLKLLIFKYFSLKIYSGERFRFANKMEKNDWL